MLKDIVCLADEESLENTSEDGDRSDPPFHATVASPSLLNIYNPLIITRAAVIPGPAHPLPVIPPMPGFQPFGLGNLAAVDEGMSLKHALFATGSLILLVPERWSVFVVDTAPENLIR